MVMMIRLFLYSFCSLCSLDEDDYWEMHCEIVDSDQGSNSGLLGIARAGHQTIEGKIL